MAVGTTIMVTVDDAKDVAAFANFSAPGASAAAPAKAAPAAAAAPAPAPVAAAAPAAAAPAPARAAAAAGGRLASSPYARKVRASSTAQRRRALRSGPPKPAAQH